MHKCGQNCRRRRGLGHCDACRHSLHPHRSASANGAGGPRPADGNSIAQQIMRVNGIRAKER